MFRVRAKVTDSTRILDDLNFLDTMLHWLKVVTVPKTTSVCSLVLTLSTTEQFDEITFEVTEDHR